MAIRLRSRKYVLSLAEVAERTSESLSSIKRQSAKNPALFAAKVQALMDMKPAPAEPQPDGLLEEHLKAISALVHLHFDLAALRWSLRESNPDLYERLGQVMGCTRPYVEEPEA
jgi:hypothetical protein